MEQSTFSFDDAGVHMHPDYYPTPPELARKLVGLLPEDCGAVLEPSAGKGDLAQAVADRFRGSWHGARLTVDVIEIVPELQAVLRDAGHRVVGSDFLQFQGHKSYDGMVMNPPFSEAEKHILHAWNLLYSGVLVSLVNAETIRNPHTKERQLIAKIIEDYGEVVETIEGAFTDAERKTDVTVAIIRLERKRTVEFDYFEGMKQAQEPDGDQCGAEFNELALSGSQIGNKVAAYNSAIRAQREAIIHQAEAKHFRHMLLEGQDRWGELEKMENLTAWVKREMNEKLSEVQKEAWRHIVYLSEFEKAMTSKTRMDFERSLESVLVMEFTEQNIRQFLINLLADRNRIFQDCLLEVFDELTRYHKENRVHVEGWKSDNYFFVNKRVVLPYIVNNDYGRFALSYGGTDILNDLDRIMAYMTGRGHTPVSVYSVLSRYDRGQGSPWGELLESQHFRIRVYKKGTTHLWFKDLDALARFNLAVGRMRGWLPKEDEKVPKEFWLMNQ